MNEHEREEFVLDCMKLHTTNDLAQRYDVCRQTVRNRKKTKWFGHIHNEMLEKITAFGNYQDLMIENVRLRNKITEMNRDCLEV